MIGIFMVNKVKKIKILKKIAKSKKVKIKSIITKFLFVKARLKMLIFFIGLKIFF
jgi:hypothetical protein